MTTTEKKTIYIYILRERERERDVKSDHRLTDTKHIQKSMAPRRVTNSFNVNSFTWDKVTYETNIYMLYIF